MGKLLQVTPGDGSEEPPPDSPLLRDSPPLADDSASACSLPALDSVPALSLTDSFSAFPAADLAAFASA
ncbi:hypothetical protein [Streptomyces sp. G-G2]|uniref:hypothetical protein n=1 Tax=Streptomyces sp. G-G2 TaxID=3046201 RepID=UPI0024BA0544|nr:hypothetical protein [Streptomyces sp. G-G2]MDJ0383691.1 hypothetical protein [Streptomyces sp. G-G2]